MRQDNHMKNNKKIGWIRLLLIFSQLLLSGFVVQWLVYQYREEKQALTQELIGQYVESQGQVFDSLLVNKVVNPAIRFKHRSSNDTLIHTSAMVTISLPDSAHVRPPESGDIEIRVSRKEDILLRSVKLFVAQTSDSIPSDTQSHAMFGGEPDTILFKTVFAERLSRKGIPVTYTWIGQPDSSIRKDNKKAILLQGPEWASFPAAQIGRFSPLIIKKISGQIAFSLILLLLTGSAFVITFLSLKKQLVLNALRNEFVGNISHELKTPVATVKVALEALQRPDRLMDPAKTAEYLNMASIEMNRLEKLVSRVLDQSLLEEKNGIPHPETLNLKELVEEVLKGFELRAESEGARLEFEKDDAECMISGDKLYISSVLVNLIDNSLKYAAPDADVCVRIDTDNDCTYLSVADNGPGIPREYHSRIFEKFFRIPGNNRHNIKGYGLGLTFAQLVMKQHGGSISVKNQDKGCIFTLCFPVNK